MRKQTKLVAVLSAAALLAIGASMTSFAATGWSEADGTWVFYNSDGSRATDTWKPSGNNWFWLDSDGSMATESLINDGDNIYYVDENGAMVVNDWRTLDNTSDEDDASERCYYFFQANGKAYKAGDATSFKTINGKKYAFDEEGRMLYGWVDGTSQRVTDESGWKEATYYCGDADDGAMTKEWKKIGVVDTDKDDVDQSYWFYFKSNGKKQTTDLTYNGRKYSIDADGKMLTGWVDNQATESVIASPTAVAGKYRYFGGSDDGGRTKGWFEVVPNSTLNFVDNDDDVAHWYYGKNDGALYTSTLATLGNKKWAFNEKGEMLTGLVAIDWQTLNAVDYIDSYVEIDTEKEFNDYAKKVAAGNSTYDLYYFGDDGAMRTSNQSVTVDGEKYSFFFMKSGVHKGKGFGNARVNTPDAVNSALYSYVNGGNSIYTNGLKVTADIDMKYQAFTNTGALMTGTASIAASSTAPTNYLVSSSGAIMKSKKNLKDGNEAYYSTNAKGLITYYSATTKQP